MPTPTKDNGTSAAAAAAGAVAAAGAAASSAEPVVHTNDADSPGDVTSPTARVAFTLQPRLDAAADNINNVPELPPVDVPVPQADDAGSVRTAVSGMSVRTIDANERSTASVGTSARMTKKTAKKTADPKDGKKKQAKKKRLSVKLKCRVKVQRKKIARLVEPDSAAGEIIKQFQRDDRNFSGTVVGKVAKNWRVKFDDFPHDHEGVILHRDVFTVLGKDEDVPEYDRMTAEDQRIAEECATTDKKSNHKKDSTDKFLQLTVEQLKTVKCYEMKYGDKDSDVVEWTVLADDEAIAEDAMNKEGTATPPMRKEIPWSPDTTKVDYNEIFFEHFFPSLKGKAKLMDKFLSNRKCPMYSTKAHDNIKFDREGEDDPDVLVSYCVTYCYYCCYIINFTIFNPSFCATGEDLHHHYDCCSM